MDTNTVGGGLTAAAMCVAAVKALRTTVPKIDGILVVLAACVLGIGITYLFGPDGESVKQLVRDGVGVGLVGSGVMTVADRVAATPDPKT